MINYFKKNVVIPFIELMKQGISPEKLALSIALGFIIGIIPFIGVSTALCAILALWFKLNIAAIQIVNYIAYPIQLIFYIPFIKAGEKILGYTDTQFTISEILKLFEGGFIPAVKILWLANLQGLFIWLIITIPVVLFLYYIFLVILSGKDLLKTE